MGNPTLSLQLSFIDGGSGTSRMAFSIDGGSTFGTAVAHASTAGVTLPATNGIYTVSVRITDAAGNAITVSQTVRLDTAGPTIGYTLTAPTNNGAYDLGANPTLTFSASDLDGVSAISATVDSTATISSGGTVNIYTLTAGAHAIVIKATDGLGNASTLTVTIQVHATIAGLVNAVNYGVANEMIASQTKSQLLATLQSAQPALGASNNTAAKSYLNTFVSQVNSGAANKITPSFGSLLVNWAQDLIARL